jgi:cytochrome b6-f complex iron-sulfur subunit
MRSLRPARGQGAYAISLAEDGQLLVDKSRTFQQELGQWKDPASFVPV